MRIEHEYKHRLDTEERHLKTLKTECYSNEDMINEL